MIEGRVIHLACRIGIAASGPDTENADDLLHRASSALATAKNSDPNSVQVYFSGREDDPSRLASLEQVVRDAAKAGELNIRYQPQVDAAAGLIAGVEALVRYDHPIYGMLPAETLLATAQRAEFGVEFGRDIMRQACREAAGWLEGLGHVRLSVNVTAADMRAEDFVPELLAILSEDRIPGGTADAGDYRGWPRRESGAYGDHAGRASGTPYPHCDRRFRHRLFLARLSEVAADSTI